MLSLLERMRAEHGVSFLFISHNLAVVERLCESLIVLYHGRVVETGTAAAVLAQPAHPYTVALRSAVPQLKGERDARLVLHGAPPDPANPPPGCVFHPRCPLVIDRCRTEVPKVSTSPLGEASPATVPTRSRRRARARTAGCDHTLNEGGTVQIRYVIPGPMSDGSAMRKSYVRGEPPLVGFLAGRRRPRSRPAVWPRLNRVDLRRGTSRAAARRCTPRTRS